MKLLASTVLGLALLGMPFARADNASLLDQLLAQTNGNEELNAQLKALVQQNQQSLNELKGLLRDDATPATPVAPATTASTTTPSAPSPQRSTGALQTASLQTSSLQSSGGLSIAHLASYPALPAVSPTSSIRQPTAEQLAHGAEVNRQIHARKRVIQQIDRAAE